MENRIYVSGTFDLLHWGHIELFKRAKAFGTVIVSVNKDEFTERYKRKPILTLLERMKMLEGIKYVDEVIVNEGDEDSRISIIKSRATHILHGDDWTGESLMKQMGFDEQWLIDNNIKLLYVPYTKEISTSEILNRCQKFL